MPKSMEIFIILLSIVMGYICHIEQHKHGLTDNPLKAFAYALFFCMTWAIGVILIVL